LVASFTVTGLQVDITFERVALQLLSEEIQGNDFQKNEQAQKKERDWLCEDTVQGLLSG
jgi:hypothetical protein